MLEAVSEELDGDKNIRNMFCTNLYFFRSPDATILKRFGRENYDCWKYHSKFLKVVEPKIIICNGNSENFSAFSAFREHFKHDPKNLRKIRLYGSVSLKSFVTENPFENRKEAVVIGIPHLSHYAPNDKFFQEIKRLINQNVAPN